LVDRCSDISVVDHVSSSESSGVRLECGAVLEHLVLLRPVLLLVLDVLHDGRSSGANECALGLRSFDDLGVVLDQLGKPVGVALDPVLECLVFLESLHGFEEGHALLGLHDGVHVLHERLAVLASGILDLFQDNLEVLGDFKELLIRDGEAKTVGRLVFGDLLL